MVLLNARNLSRGDVHRLLGIEPRYNGAFTTHLTLEPLSAIEQTELSRIQDEFRRYWADGRISEGQVQPISVGPMLRLASYHQPPLRLDVEEDIDRIYIEDEDTHITGRFDVVAINKAQGPLERRCGP